MTDDKEKEALEISDKGMDAIKNFVTGFSKFVEETKIKNKEEILKMYSKTNIATLIYNAMILEEELKKRLESSEEEGSRQ